MAHFSPLVINPKSSDPVVINDINRSQVSEISEVKFSMFTIKFYDNPAVVEAVEYLAKQIGFAIPDSYPATTTGKDTYMQTYRIFVKEEYPPVSFREFLNEVVRMEQLNENWVNKATVFFESIGLEVPPRSKQSN